MFCVHVQGIVAFPLYVSPKDISSHATRLDGGTIDDDEASDHCDREWAATPFRGRTPHVAGTLFTRRIRPHRNPHWLRYLTMWRMYSATQWRVRQILYGAGSSG